MSFFAPELLPISRAKRARNATERASASAVSPETHALTAIPSSPHPGVPWTEDEHRLFLLGLQKLGKVRARFGFPPSGSFSQSRQPCRFPARARDPTPRAHARRERPLARARLDIVPGRVSGVPRGGYRAGTATPDASLSSAHPGGTDRRSCASRCAVDDSEATGAACKSVKI